MNQSITNQYTTKHGSSPFLGDNNYTSWASHMRILLKGAGVFRIIDGSELPPQTTTTGTRRAGRPGRPGTRQRDNTPDISQLSLEEPTAQELRLQDYIKRRDLAVSLIFNSLSNSTKELVAEEEDPNRMWTILKERKNTALNDVAAANIRGQFNRETWKDSDTLSSWYSRLLNYKYRLAGSRGEVREWDVAMMLLNGLPSHWEVAKHQIMGAYPQLELGNVISALESRAELVSPPTATSSSGSGNTEALISTPGFKEKPYQGNGNGNSNGNGNGNGNGNRRSNYRGRQRYNSSRKHNNDDRGSKK